MFVLNVFVQCDWYLCVLSFVHTMLVCYSLLLWHAVLGIELMCLPIFVWHALRHSDIADWLCHCFCVRLPYLTYCLHMSEHLNLLLYVPTNRPVYVCHITAVCVGPGHIRNDLWTQACMLIPLLPNQLHARTLWYLMPPLSPSRHSHGSSDSK
jgi:hypothetical protein